MTAKEQEEDDDCQFFFANNDSILPVPGIPGLQSGIFFGEK